MGLMALYQILAWVAFQLTISTRSHSCNKLFWFKVFFHSCTEMNVQKCKEILPDIAVEFLLESNFNFHRRYLHQGFWKFLYFVIFLPVLILLSWWTTLTKTEYDCSKILSLTHVWRIFDPIDFILYVTWFVLSALIGQLWNQNREICWLQNTAAGFAFELRLASKNSKQQPKNSKNLVKSWCAKKSSI